MKKSISKIISRPLNYNMVGDGFRVFNYLPSAVPNRELSSPFLMLDFNPAFDFGASSTQRGVDVHPHKGFETVTIAYKGSVAHHDSTGNTGVIHPGDVQWMTAGAGILHKEYHEKTFAKTGGEFEMVQLWVNLPAKNKLSSPGYQALESDKITMEKIPNDGGYVKIIAGNYNGTAGSAKTFTDINLFDIRMNPNGELNSSIPASHNTMLLVISGKAEVNGKLVDQHQMALFNNEGEELHIKALSESIILLMSGEPIKEPIAQYGPFVMNTQAELQTAFKEFQEGKFGVLN